MLRPAVHLREKAEDPREVKVEGIGVLGFLCWRISPGSHAGNRLQEKRPVIGREERLCAFTGWRLYFIVRRVAGYNMSPEQTGLTSRFLAWGGK
jgi:hypothetical protein